jgi:hypothetical protein
MGAFDIVACRLPSPEMVRVARPGGGIVLCDAFVSDDPAEAAAFNTMERFRDPSKAKFRPLPFLR